MRRRYIGNTAFIDITNLLKITIIFFQSNIIKPNIIVVRILLNSLLILLTTLLGNKGIDLFIASILLLE